MIGVDTGLTHLAAAYGVPCVAIFSATGAELFAPLDPGRAKKVGDLNQVPPLEAVAGAVTELLTPTSAVCKGQ